MDRGVDQEPFGAYSSLGRKRGRDKGKARKWRLTRVKADGAGAGDRGTPPTLKSCHIAAPVAWETSRNPADGASPLWILSLWLGFAAWAAGSGDKQGRQCPGQLAVVLWPR